MAPTHGPQFDEFRADSGTPHNGAQADTGYGTRGAEPHGGLLFDEKYTAAAVDVAHGARFDDFPWQPVPFGHGARYDQGFDEPVAGDPAHGTWHDVFRGGHTQANVIVDGRDVQALVIETHASHAVGLTSDGRRVDFGLSQLREWRRANSAGMPSAGVKAATAGDGGVVTAPSASAPARGSQAQANGGQRSGVAAETGSSAMTVKTIADGDVAKRGSAYAVTQGAGKMRVNVGPFCKKCGGTVKKALAGSSMAAHPHVGACRSCGTNVGKTTDEIDVAKDVDATETALQAKGGSVGHRTGCPRGGNAPCGAEQGGHCTVCKAEVHDHQALGKTTSLVEVLDVLKGLSS